ncbi:MAG: cytochrome D1 domain-containing protein, partial [Candidatus Bipolaricaulia bacterium]
RIIAGYKTHVIAYNPVDERWAYLIARNGWVFKLDLYSLKPLRKVRVGIDSRSLAVSSDGRYILAGNYIPNSAVILDAQTLEPLKVIETYGIDPDGEVVDSRVGAALTVGQRFVLVLQEAGCVWLIDYSRPGFPIVKTIDRVGHLLLGAYLVPGGRYLITGSLVDDFVAVLDLEEQQVVKRVPTGKKPYMGAGAAVEVGGRKLLFVPAVGENKITVLEVGSWKVVKYIFTKGPGLFVASHPQSRYIWADVAFGPNSGAVHIIDKQTLKIVKTRWPGRRSIHPEFTADGRYVYVSAWGEDKVVVYDATTLERVKEFTDVKTPTGIFAGWRAGR